MRNRAWFYYLAVCSLGVAACGGDDDAGGAGTGGGAGQGGSGHHVESPDPINPLCPQNDVGPFDGPYAQKGACCYRTSNKARIDPSADTFTLEFRTNYFFLVNHRKTIDPNVLGPIQISRADEQEQSLLFRFVVPQKNGEAQPGRARVTFGPGRYNCDGTYSFYGENAAAAYGGSDPARWAGPEFEANVYPDKTDHDFIRPTYKESLEPKNRLSYLPYLGAAPDFALDWEGQSQGFDILEMPSGPEHYDCVGERKDAGSWKPAGKTKAFARLDLNNKDTIDALGVTFCQLMAFGATGGSADCLATPRCTPGEDKDCKWQRLPDSLCPVTDEEKASWGCHLGYGGNPDNEPVVPNCSKEPLSEIDPDKGTPEGQCCDPTGSGKDNLPACNAWLQINDFVAAAVEITDERTNELQQNCHGKP